VSKSTVSQIIDFVQFKINSHWGCRGSKYCPQCNMYREILDFVYFGNVVDTKYASLLDQKEPSE